MSPRTENNVVAFPPRHNKCPQLSDDEIRRLFHPTVNQLPFVARRDDGKICDFSPNYWKVPSGEPVADVERGKEYAALTIDALYVDGCGHRALQRIFDALVADAIARRAKGGRYSRTNLPPAADGFLQGLSRFICAAVAAERQRAQQP